MEDIPPDNVDNSSKLSIIESKPLFDYSDLFTTDKEFETKEELLAWVRCIGRNTGYVIIKQTTSNAYGGRKSRMTLACERSGSYHVRTRKPVLKDCLPGTTPKKPQLHRQTGTKKCQCPFQLKAFGQHSGFWTLHIVNGSHNHPPADYLEGHAYVGRLTSEEKEFVIELSHNLVRPRGILSMLKKRDPGNCTTMRTIYNFRANHRLVEKGARTEMQYLMKKLEMNNYVVWHKFEKEGSLVVDSLFYAHPDSLELLRAFPGVLIMDCTYKTNRYRLPLLEIVGVTSTNTTYTVGFAFLNSEQEGSYTWAMDILKKFMRNCPDPRVIITDRDLALMNAIEVIFPNAKHQLCVWHINRDVASNTHKLFDGNELAWYSFQESWNKVIFSSTKDEYVHNLTYLETAYTSYPKVMEYINKTWLIYKEGFVAAWTIDNMHFGNITTNRCESQHARLKLWIGTSSLGHERLWEAIHDLNKHILSDVRKDFEISSLVVPHRFVDPLYRYLRGVVSIAALDLIRSEDGRDDNPGTDKGLCGCQMRKIYGLPCSHEINEFRMMNQAIPIDSIFPHWKKLDFLPLDINDNSTAKYDPNPFYNLINKRLELSGDDVSYQIIEGLRVLSSPELNRFFEPRVKEDGKGRRRTTSTKRNRSRFEQVMKGASASKKEKKVWQEKKECRAPPFQRQKLPVIRHVEPPLKPTFPLKSSLPLEPTPLSVAPTKLQSIWREPMLFDMLPGGIKLKPFTKSVTNVVSDGNCGFRVIAKHIYSNEEQWISVREDLKKVMSRHRDRYIALLGVDDVVSIESSLEFAQRDSFAPRNKWMSLPDMGWLIAECYRVALIFLSEMGSSTIFPLFSPPMAIKKELGILYLHNEEHFVKVDMHEGCPLPRLHRSWETYKDDVAIGWMIGYPERYEAWKVLMEDRTTVEKSYIITDEDNAPVDEDGKLKEEKLSTIDLEDVTPLDENMWNMFMKQ